MGDYSADIQVGDRPPILPAPTPMQIRPLKVKSVSLTQCQRVTAEHTGLRRYRALQCSAMPTRGKKIVKSIFRSTHDFRHLQPRRFVRRTMQPMTTTGGYCVINYVTTITCAAGSQLAHALRLTSRDRRETVGQEEYLNVGHRAHSKLSSPCLS